MKDLYHILLLKFFYKKLILYKINFIEIEIKFINFNNIIIINIIYFLNI